jgi:hypothetical protein
MHEGHAPHGHGHRHFPHHDGLFLFMFGIVLMPIFFIQVALIFRPVMVVVIILVMAK